MAKDSERDENHKSQITKSGGLFTPTDSFNCCQNKSIQLFHYFYFHFGLDTLSYRSHHCI